MAPETNSLPATPVSRRNLMRGIGATAAGAAGVRYAPDRMNPVGEADAIAPIVLYGAAAAAGVVAGWLVRNHDPLAADTPSTGLSASALSDHVYQTADTRKSTNASTFVDNRNIINSGLSNTLYSEGKLAAIDALNNGKTEAEVETAALNAMEAYMTTIETNFLKSWNEATAEYSNLATAVRDHSSLSWINEFNYWNDADPTNDWEIFQNQTTSITLADGTSFTLNQLEADPSGTNDYIWDATQSIGNTGHRVEVTAGASMFPYLRSDEWTAVWGDLQAVKTSVNDGLIVWVGNVYSQVQSGEIDTTDLLSSKDLAELDSGDSPGVNQAVRDLLALGISAEAGTYVEVNLPSVDATIEGKLAVTGDTTVSTGTVDPSVTGNSYYLTYDVSEGTGNWTAYNTGVDGGIVSFTSEPHPETAYLISTSASETAEVLASDFTENTTDGTWEVDISGKVETSITNIESVEYYATVTDSVYETIQLLDPFEVVSFTDGDGNSQDSATYESPTSQDDTNYVTQEEWEQRAQKYDELIALYEESSGGGGGGGTTSSLDIITWAMNNPALAAGGGLAVIAGWTKLTN